MFAFTQLNTLPPSQPNTTPPSHQVEPATTNQPANSEVIIPAGFSDVGGKLHALQQKGLTQDNISVPITNPAQAIDFLKAAGYVVSSQGPKDNGNTVYRASNPKLGLGHITGEGSDYIVISANSKYNPESYNISIRSGNLPYAIFIAKNKDNLSISYGSPTNAAKVLEWGEKITFVNTGNGVETYISGKTKLTDWVKKYFETSSKGIKPGNFDSSTALAQ